MDMDQTMNLSPEFTVGICCFMDMDQTMNILSEDVPWLISATTTITKTITTITKDNTLAMKTLEQNRQKRKTHQ
jgi:hypothetical protein